MDKNIELSFVDYSLLLSDSIKLTLIRNYVESCEGSIADIDVLKIFLGLKGDEKNV